MTKADIIREFITKNPTNAKGANWDKQDLAEELSGIHGGRREVWRSAVRRVTGSMGEENRSKIKNPNMLKFFFNGFEKWSAENLNTEERPFDAPFVIPTSIKNLSIINDLHGQYLDDKVMTSFLRRTKDKTAVFINGDLLDSEALSRHLKTHNMIEYDKELELCHQILKGLKQEFNHVYFKEGNHDFWLERYLLTNAREIFRLRGLDLKTLLRLGELGVEHIHNLKYFQYGDLDGVHGHEFPGFGMGKFPAVSLLDKWQTFKHSYSVKVVGAHCHRIDEAISRKSKTGEFGQAWTVGCMCKKQAAYNPYAGWEQGWGEASINADGKTEFKNIWY